MKKIFTLCVVLCLSYLSMGATNLKHEFRATWLTTAWGNDWPDTTVTNDATRKLQQDELIAIFDRLQAGNMNAVCMQVRGRSDAFYQSSYEPWAAELAGARGKDPGYDPLAFAIEEAHKRGLELHAWVNPFRVTSAGTLDANDLVKKNAGQWIIQYNNGTFTGEIIDPGYPEAREYVLNVLMEIISNYDIDGIVMDDYFYPYGGTTTEDAASKALHKPVNVVDVNQDGDTDDDWRRSNVDVFLKELYDRIQAKKPWVRFGMGTFGIWTTQSKVAQAYGISLPSGISGLDDYDVQACNPVEWVKNGYVDYINPQLYWPTTSTRQNYDKLCQWWAKDVCEHFSDQLTNGKKVHFFSSQSISSNSAVSEIQAQIDVNRSHLSSGYTGSVFFDTDAYLTMDNALMTSRFATHALPPAMDWKSNTALAAPTNLTVSGSTLTWQHATAERFTVYVYPKGTAWSTAKNDPAYLQGVIYGKSMDISGIDTNANDIAVCAYDRYGVEHTAAVYSNDSGTVTPPASGTITYVLNGGMMNEFGWTSKDDMFQACMADCGVTTLPSLDEIKATGNDAALTTICTKLTDVSGMLNSDKWDWLEQYIMEVQNAQAGTSIGAGSVSVLTAGVTSATWRYALAAFFIEGQRTTWPYSADFLQAGKDEAYIPAWKHVYTNPTSVTTEFTLYDPCREGYTFLGWYANADFSSEKVTTINAETTGTLYAKWINNDWIITYTSTDGNIVTPYKTDVFGANIVNNEYKDGQGVITFDGPVTSIGNIAFKYCSSLISITIPKSVTSIGDFAFNGCSSLSSITIPNSVTSIGDRAFSSCDSLISIVVEDGNATYDSRTNCNAIIETATNTLIAGCQNTIIPNSVTSIGSHAFSNCSSLTSITIPNSVTSIGSHAFSNCSSLTSITIPNSVTSIGDRAFRYCTSLTSITIPNSVMSIGEVAFYHCTSLASVVIPESVTSIGDWAFSYCTSLASVVIPESVTSIGDRAFSYCTSLASVVIPESVTSIGDRAFVYCSGLTSVTIPNSVTSIGDYTFLGCSSITSMVVESGNTTYDSRENCNAIIETATNTLITGCQNTVIPNSVTSIGQTAFYCCYSLRSIALPNNITTIGDSAFFDCTSLMSVTIPGSVRLIGTNAFYNCTNIAKTNFLGDIEDWCNIEFERYSSNPITYSHNLYINDQEINDVVIPNTIDSIKRYTFYRCASLTSVTLPDGITTIGERAFTSCTSLKSLTIPESVTFIADAAFALCESLETMYIHAITPPILEGEILFTGSPISTCYIPCGTLAAYESSAWASQVGEFIEEGCPTVQMCGDDLYWEYADGVLTITGTGDMYDYADDKTGPAPWYDVRGSITTINMPNEMTKIGDYAFYKCTEVTSINMPTSLTAIGEKAFAQDTRLACEIILPASMTTIASRAFFNCQAVTAFHIEATTPPTIPNDAFERTTAPIHVPCGYGHIYGKHTQWGMLNLEMCELLQDNVYYYPIDGHTARAVTYHSNPTDTIVLPSAVVIDGMPRTVTEVADFAFTDCANLPAISFNEGLEYIGERAFVRCYGLHGTIVLPATLETIGERAFSYCDNVEKYLIQAMTPPALGDGAFTCANHDALFYVSCEVMDDYKVAARWSSLKSRLRDACLNIYHYNTALGTNGVYTTEDTLVASIYYRRQFTPYRWETLYLPFEVDRVTVLEDGVEYDLKAWDIKDGGHYFIAKPDGWLNMEIIFGFTDELDAHIPYIIQFKDDYYRDKIITFYGKESWNKLSTSFEVLSSSSWMQIAGNTTLQDQLLEKPVYMLRSDLDFILQKTTTTLHPFECYVMPYATPSGTPARMNVRFRGDVPTAVESVKGNESHLTYTVDGYTLTVYPQGQAFSIYSLNGALIYSCEAGKEAVDCELNSGCYLLHAGTEAHKIML